MRLLILPDIHQRLAAAHLGVEVALQRVGAAQQEDEVTPAQLCGKRADGLGVGEEFIEAHHRVQIGATKAASELGGQLFRQRPDNLIAVVGGLGGEDVPSDAVAHLWAQPNTGRADALMGPELTFALDDQGSWHAV